MKLSEQVDLLERDNKRILALCGEMIATLSINFKRQEFKLWDGDENDVIKPLFDRWESTYRECKANADTAPGAESNQGAGEKEREDAEV